jgi:high affinity Mn2+ porin
LSDGASSAAGAQCHPHGRAGGLGGIIGDGQLPSAGEQILEAYYSVALFSFARFTADYQFIKNPAYNRDRGPVSVFGLRLHVQY